MDASPSSQVLDFCFLARVSFTTVLGFNGFADGDCSDSNQNSILPKRKLDELVDTPSSRSSGGDVDGFFASGSPLAHSGGSGGFKARDMAARAGGGGALTPVIKRRAILHGGDRTPVEPYDAEAAAAAASALLAVRSSEGPKR